MTDANEIVHVYSPRDVFIPFHQRTKRWSALVCHRRAGKTVAAVNDIVARALYSSKKNSRYAYLAPFYRQAKEIAWQYLKDATRNGMAKRVSEAELSVTLLNDAKISLFGADNPDSMRGVYNDGVILDEFGDMRPSLWGEVILPTLADRKGWAVVMGTPKGRNQFYHAVEKAKSDPENWFSMILPASTSGILDEETLKEMRSQMSDEAYAQEFEVDFTAAVAGTYYARQITELENQGRISDLQTFEEGYKVYCASDIGKKDGAAWWFWQETPRGVVFFDYEENHGLGAEENIKLLKDKGYDYEIVWLPHDAVAQTFQSTRSTLEQFLEADLPCRIVPKLSRQDGIEAARLVLRDHAVIHKSKCALGVEALRFYHREWSEISKSFQDNPYKDWSSEAADAFRYASIVCKQGRVSEKAQTPKEFRVQVTPITLDGLFQDRERYIRAHKRIEM